MKAAKKIVEIASNHGGAVYADYVTKVIIPTLKGDKIDESISLLRICSNGKPFKSMIAEIKKNCCVQKQGKDYTGTYKMYTITSEDGKFSLCVVESRSGPYRPDLSEVMFKIVDDKYIRVDDYGGSLYYLLNNIDNY